MAGNFKYRTIFLQEARANTGLAVAVTQVKIKSTLYVIGLFTMHKKAEKIYILQNKNSFLSHFFLTST
jgi:hypothetical protein